MVTFPKLIRTSCDAADAVDPVWEATGEAVDERRRAKSGRENISQQTDVEVHINSSHFRIFLMGGPI